VKRKRRKPLEATAYHEAGHAVAAFVMGRSVRKISIVPDPAANSLGSVHGYRWRGENPETSTNYERMLVRVQIQIIRDLAGGEAEARFTGRRNHIGEMNDRASANHLMGYICTSPKEEEAMWKWLTLRTRGLIGLRWNWIQAIAKELLKKKELTGAEARLLWLTLGTQQKGYGGVRSELAR
jgi:hypothetical protein